MSGSMCLSWKWFSLEGTDWVYGELLFREYKLQHHTTVARLLIDAGAESPKLTRAGSHFCLLHPLGHTRVSKRVCNAGPEKTKADDYGVTALMFASQEGHKQVARRLIGAKVKKYQGLQPCLLQAKRAVH